MEPLSSTPQRRGPRPPWPAPPAPPASQASSPCSGVLGPPTSHPLGPKHPPPNSAPLLPTALTLGQSTTSLGFRLPSLPSLGHRPDPRPLSPPSPPHQAEFHPPQVFAPLPTTPRQALLPPGLGLDVLAQDTGTSVTCFRPVRQLPAGGLHLGPSHSQAALPFLPLNPVPDSPLLLAPRSLACHRADSRSPVSTAHGVTTSPIPPPLNPYSTFLGP